MSLLTPKGIEFAERLRTTPREFMASALSPAEEFHLMLPTVGWSLANECLVIMDSALPEIEKKNLPRWSISIGAWLGTRIAMPAEVGEEILFQLIADEFVYPLDGEVLEPWVAAVAALLSSESRLKILQATLMSPCTSRDLRDLLDDAPMMTMRNHLMPLVEAGFVEESRGGKYVEYSASKVMLVVFLRRVQRLLGVVA